MELRKYLLGILSETQAEEVEKLLLFDDKSLQNIEIAEDRIIQDFVDGSLSQTEEQAFRKNFIITEERSEKIKIAHAYRRLAAGQPNIQPEKKPSFFDTVKSFLSSPLPVFCIIILLLVSATLIWRNYSQQSEILVALNQAQKGERTLDARLTDLEYAQKKEGTRGKNEQENPALQIARARAAQAVDSNPTAENYHELGRVYLVERNFDQATKQLEKGVALNPGMAKLNNDLGVALLEKGKIKAAENNELFIRANELIEKSIQEDKTLKEAYFNRALILEQLKKPEEAKEAWENYLKIDAAGRWADEARDRLKKLTAVDPLGKLTQ